MLIAHSIVIRPSVGRARSPVLSPCLEAAGGRVGEVEPAPVRVTVIVTKRDRAEQQQQIT